MSAAEDNVKQNIDQAQQLIVVESTPAVLSVNFDEMNAHLDQWLDQYQTVVTQDGVKQAKAQATEINKLKAAISKRKKEEIDRVSAPITKFKQDMTALETKCEDTRQGILDQVKVFEDETREKAFELLDEMRAKLWNEEGVQDEFKSAQIDDLALVSNVTDKGALGKKAKDTLTQRVRDDKAQQDAVEKRLLVLENRSYKAGLREPLTRQTIEHFLRADDDTYEAKLQSLLDAEVKRQEETERRLREDMEREQRQKEAQREESTPPPAATAGPASGPINNAPVHEQADEVPVDVPPDKVLVTATATFKITVPPHVGNEVVAQKLRAKLEEAGITTLDEIHVSRS